MPGVRRGRWLAWLPAAAALAWSGAAVAQQAGAPGTVLERLEDRVAALERRLGRQVAEFADGGGSAARNSVRLSELETELGKLTGRIEELTHDLDTVAGAVDAIKLRIEELAARIAPAPAEDEVPAADGAATAEPAADATETATPEAVGAADTAALPQPAPDSPASDEPAAGALPAGSPRDQYAFALDLMLEKKDFEGAEEALREFIARHPGHRLAANAHYWLGETYYFRGNFRDAALTFGEGFRRHARSGKAPDTLLKLGMALARLDQTRQACTAFATLEENFPDAARRLARRIESERTRSKCR